MNIEFSEYKQHNEYKAIHAEQYDFDEDFYRAIQPVHCDAETYIEADFDLDFDFEANFPVATQPVEKKWWELI